MEVTRKLRQKLSDKKGSSMLAPVVALLVGIPFLILLYYFIYIYTMILGLSDYMQQAILQTADTNAYNVFKGVREGNSSAHMYAGNDIWDEIISTGEVQQRLKDMLGMERQGSRLTKEKDGVARYALSNMETSCANVSVGSGGNDVTLTFKARATVELPMYFMGTSMTVRKTVALTSYYTPLF